MDLKLSHYVTEVYPSLCIPYGVVGLSKNEFSEQFLRKLVNYFQELGMVLDKFGTMFKALVISQRLYVFAFHFKC